MNAPTKFYSYGLGTDPVVVSGALKPFGDRLLLRAILATDGSTLHVVTHNSTDAECFEVIGVGGGVAAACEMKDEEPIKIGQHVDVRSTAADRIRSKDPVGRFWLVSVEDVTAVWDPCVMDENMVAICNRIAETNANAAAVAPPAGSLLIPGVK